MDFQIHHVRNWCKLKSLIFRAMYQKEKKTTKRNWTYQTPARIWLKKDHRRRKGVFYFRALGWQSFFKTTKIATLLKAQFMDLEISEISI